MIKVTGRDNQPRHYSRAENHGKALPLRRILQILLHAPPFEHLDVKERSAQMFTPTVLTARLSVSEQVRVIAPQIVVRPKLMERLIGVDGAAY